MDLIELRLKQIQSSNSNLRSKTEVHSKKIPPPVGLMGHEHQAMACSLDLFVRMNMPGSPGNLLRYTLPDIVEAGSG